MKLLGEIAAGVELSRLRAELQLKMTVGLAGIWEQWTIVNK